MNGEQHPERRGNGIALRWSHLVMALAVYLLTIGVIYGTMRNQVDELRTQVFQLQQEAIQNKQFTEFKEDVQRRLQRIEDKIDRERSIRSLH